MAILLRVLSMGLLLFASSPAVCDDTESKFLKSSDVMWLRPTKPIPMREMYPSRAIGLDLAGSAALDCGVNAEGGLIDGRVLEDTPPYYGFGGAAVSVAQTYFRMRLVLRTGAPVSSQARVRVVIKFAQPDLVLGLKQDRYGGIVTTDRLPIHRGRLHPE